jgi:hypothetical protein
VVHPENNDGPGVAHPENRLEPRQDRRRPCTFTIHHRDSRRELWRPDGCSKSIIVESQPIVLQIVLTRSSSLVVASQFPVRSDERAAAARAAINRADPCVIERKERRDYECTFSHLP